MPRVNPEHPPTPSPLHSRPRSKDKRKPWLRGPVAHQLVDSMELILIRLDSIRQKYLSLRMTAECLGISTEPIRKWKAGGWISGDGPRGQYSKDELKRFLLWLKKYARPYPMKTLALRFHNEEHPEPRPFLKLYSAKFSWPKERKALTPSELGRLIGCHPSLLVKAIDQGIVRGRRRSAYRWEIPKSNWRRVFPARRRNSENIS